MATPNKLNSSASGPFYTSGQRGTYTAASVERSGSFQKTMDNPVPFSLPKMSRSSPVLTQGDVLSFLKCLRFDPKLLAAEFKSTRHGDFTQNISVALDISTHDSSSCSSKVKLSSSPSHEELKRAKAVLRERSVRARERIKIFTEALSVLHKFLPSKKRSRLDTYSHERSATFLAGNRSAGSSLSKIGTSVQGITTGFELEQQKPEPRVKNTVPNKRTHTSMVDSKVDGRSNSLVKPPGAVDRLVSTGAVQSEDQSSPISIHRWEKSKMKKKRSVIKPDISSGLVPTTSIDGYREVKKGWQQRPNNGVRSRMNSNYHGFSTGVANATAGVGKADGLSQLNGLEKHSSIPRADLEISSLLIDREDHPNGSDKERLNEKPLNKPNIQDEFNSTGSVPTAKLNSSVRALRSASNRKRSASSQSSSPPVAHWAGQRPQKISRSARKTNFGPIVSSNDETLILDTASEVTGNEAGFNLGRRFPGSFRQHAKSKGDPLSSTIHSESEESLAADTKTKDKGKISADAMEEKPIQDVQKAPALVLPSKKNKLVSRGRFGDGIRRKGRTGRAFTPTSSLSRMTSENLGSVGNVKQLRAAENDFNKKESKGGRPPTRKLSDRKAYPSQRHFIDGGADFCGEGQGDLLAAANAFINSIHAYPTSFWRQMEPYFSFISDADIAYLRQQGNLQTNAPPNSLPVDANYCGTILNGFISIDCERETELNTETTCVGSSPNQLERKGTTIAKNCIPFCQRLMAALISEDENSDVCNGGEDDDMLKASASSYELDEELESAGLNNKFLENFKLAESAALNGYMTRAKSKHNETGSDGMDTVNIELYSDISHSSNGFFSDQASMTKVACSEFPYAEMNINDKLLLEIQSIGIFPDWGPVTEWTEDELGEEISKLEKLHGQVSKTKVKLHRLLKSAMETKTNQEKEFEEHALDKLVEMAYQKYMSCRPVNSSGSKSMNSRLAKQAALAFVRRTLDRCQNFENTGKSCFSEPVFREIFLSGPSCLDVGAQAIDKIADGGPFKQFASTSKISASLQSPSLTSQLDQNIDSHDASSSDAFVPLGYSSEQSTIKEDTWTNRVKKREALLDDVVGGIVGTLSGAAATGVTNCLLNSTKGKRSDRDREGKEHSREVIHRNGNKIGWPALSGDKGERKFKTKPKQKTTQLSISVNGLCKKSEQPKSAVAAVSSSSNMASNSSAKQKEGFNFDGLEDPIDLSHLQLPGMDVLGGPDEQGQDLGSWLNIDDDNLQDHDTMGLEIPMDDLSDLNMII